MNNAGLLSFDFVHVFPHLAWISNWSSDAQYPAGYQYKLLSARHEPEDIIEFLVILQHRSGDKEVLKSLSINAAAFDRAAAIFVDGLAKQHQLDFEKQDFILCRDLASFDAAAARFGWRSAIPEDAG